MNGKSDRGRSKCAKGDVEGGGRRQNEEDHEKGHYPLDPRGNLKINLGRYHSDGTSIIHGFRAGLLGIFEVVVAMEFIKNIEEGLKIEILCVLSSPLFMFLFWTGASVTGDW